MKESIQNGGENLEHYFKCWTERKYKSSFCVMIDINRNINCQNNSSWCSKHPIEFMKFLVLNLMSESGVQQACPVFFAETMCLVNSDTIITWLVISLEQTLSSEANRSPANREIPHILWKPEFHGHIHLHVFMWGSLMHWEITAYLLWCMQMLLSWSWFSVASCMSKCCLFIFLYLQLKELSSKLRKRRLHPMIL